MSKKDTNYGVSTCVRWVFVALFVTLSGCTTVQTFPDKARAGDTITLSVGSADGMTRSNTTITYLSDSGPSVDLTPNIRAITKIYPDKTSEAWLFDDLLLGNIPTYSSHGPWDTMVVVDLPTGMPLGTGNIQVTTGAVYPTTALGVNAIPISLEILNGTGTPNPFNFRVTGTADISGNLSLIEPLPQAVIRQPVGAVAPNYGAIEIIVKATIKKADGVTGVPDSDIRIVVDDMGPTNLTSQLQSSWVRNTKLFTVNFISPTGLMKYYESRFSIVIRPGDIFADPQPTIQSVTYYDINGNVTTGPAPTITVE